MVVFCGIPLFALETAAGQFCSQGAINVWRAVPIMQGKRHTAALHIWADTFHLTFEQYLIFCVISQAWASLCSWGPRW